MYFICCQECTLYVAKSLELAQQLVGVADNNINYESIIIE